MKIGPKFVFRVNYKKGSFVVMAFSKDAVLHRYPDSISVELIDTYKNMCKNTKPEKKGN